MTRDGKTTQGDLDTSEVESPLIANKLSKSDVGQTWKVKY